MRDNITFGNPGHDAIELPGKCGGPEIFVEKRLQMKKNSLLNKLARDSVLQETRLRSKIHFHFARDLFKSTRRTLQRLHNGCAEI